MINAERFAQRMAKRELPPPPPHVRGLTRWLMERMSCKVQRVEPASTLQSRPFIWMLADDFTREYDIRLLPSWRGPTVRLFTAAIQIGCVDFEPEGFFALTLRQAFRLNGLKAAVFYLRYYADLYVIAKRFWREFDYHYEFEDSEDSDGNEGETPRS